MLYFPNLGLLIFFLRSSALSNSRNKSVHGMLVQLKESSTLLTSQGMRDTNEKYKRFPCVRTAISLTFMIFLNCFMCRKVM